MTFLTPALGRVFGGGGGGRYGGVFFMFSYSGMGVGPNGVGGGTVFYFHMDYISCTEITCLSVKLTACGLRGIRFVQIFKKAV